MARASSTAKKTKKTRVVRKTRASSKKNRVEEVKKDKAALTTSSAASIYYGSLLDSLEKTNHIYSNSAKYLSPMSSGVLVIDWILGGGLRNSFISVAGPEASGKTTQLMHQLASAQANKIPFTIMVDAEGTLNPEFAEHIFNIYGLSYDRLINDKHSSFRYYRNNVIETVFDLAHGIFKRMPDKIWLPDNNTWAYCIPKRDKHFADLMAKMELTPSKALSTEGMFICPTDYSSLEGVMLIDSFAAMVTKSDDESETKSKIRAAEAAGFSNNLKRIAANISSKGILLSGVNQLRKTPGKTYGDPEYEPGGDALKFYSSQRMRMRHRSSGFRTDTVTRDKDTGQMMESSVHKTGAIDYYKYKFIKNTKNKISYPHLSGWVRVWVKDAFNNVRGIDPVFDAMEYLRLTNQIQVTGRKKGIGNLYKFTLRDSVTRKRADFFNSLKDFSYPAFKGFILGHADGDTRLFELISKETKADLSYFRRFDLRKYLFQQLQVDKTVLAKPSKSSGDDDYGGDEDGEEI